MILKLKIMQAKGIKGHILIHAASVKQAHVHYVHLQQQTNQKALCNIYDTDAESDKLVIWHVCWSNKPVVR